MNKQRCPAEDFLDMEKRMRVLSDEGHSLADDWADMAHQAAGDLCAIYNAMLAAVATHADRDAEGKL